MNENVTITKRLTAYLLDIIIVFLVINLTIGIKFLNPTFEKYNEAYKTYEKISKKYIDGKIEEKEFLKIYEDSNYLLSKYGISNNVIILIYLFSYFVIFQKYNKGQTLGKKIIKIKIVNENNEQPSIWKYSLRMLPMYYVYIGSIIPIIINTILILTLKKSLYLLISAAISYIFLGISFGTFIIMLFRKDKKGLHDLLAGTKVVYEK